MPSSLFELMAAREQGSQSRGRTRTHPSAESRKTRRPSFDPCTCTTNDHQYAMRHKMEVASLYVLTPKANNDKQRRVRLRYGKMQGRKVRSASVAYPHPNFTATCRMPNLPDAERLERRKECMYFAQGEFGRSQTGLCRWSGDALVFGVARVGEVAQLLEVDEVPLLYEWSCSIALLHATFISR